MHAWPSALDPWLVWAFRLTHSGTSAFVLGCVILSLLSVLLGFGATIVMLRVNRFWYRRLYEDMIRMHNLSVQALEHGDKNAYLASNKQAMEAFGKYFFSQAAVFMVSLWPLPPILAWMDLRFRHVPLTLAGFPIPYFVVMILAYIGVRLLVGSLVDRLEPYRRLRTWADHRGGIVPRHFEDLGKD